MSGDELRSLAVVGLMVAAICWLVNWTMTRDHKVQIWAQEHGAHVLTEHRYYGNGIALEHYTLELPDHTFIDEDELRKRGEI